MSNHLLRVLGDMLPDAEISPIAERPWHSLTFAGTQISYVLTLSGNDHAAICGQFAGQLANREFDTHDYIVADIAVTDKVSGESKTRLTIDALLLDH